MGWFGSGSGKKSCCSSAQRPKHRHQEDGEQEDNQGEQPADLDKVDEAVEPRSIDHQAGRLEGGEVGSGGSQGDHHRKGARGEPELQGDLQGDRDDDGCAAWLDMG
jgi:hypothetical protein